MNTLFALLVALSAAASDSVKTHAYDIDLFSYLKLAKELDSAGSESGQVSLTFPMVMVFNDSGVLTGHGAGSEQEVLSKSLQEFSFKQDTSVELGSVLALLPDRYGHFNGYTVVQIVASSEPGVCPPCDSQKTRIESFIESSPEPIRLFRLSVGVGG